MMRQKQSHATGRIVLHRQTISSNLLNFFERHVLFLISRTIGHLPKSFFFTKLTCNMRSTNSANLLHKYPKIVFFLRNLSLSLFLSLSMSEYLVGGSHNNVGYLYVNDWLTIVVVEWFSCQFLRVSVLVFSLHYFIVKQCNNQPFESINVGTKIR